MTKKTSVLVYTYLKAALGAVIYAAGFRLFLYPHSIVVGGLTGISMIINFMSGLPVGIMVIVMNIPLFAISWKRFGLGFIILSLFSMILSSLLTDAFGLLDWSITDEPLLACIYGGLIKGLGLGIIYSTGGSTGGSDIVAKFLRLRYPYVNFGTLLLLLDVAVVLVFTLCFKRYDSAMYAIIAMFISSKTIDFVLYGVSNSKVCYIISDASEEIKHAINENLNRGVTILHGAGAYSGKEKDVILCVIKRQQIVEVRSIIKRYDENAFVIMSDSREVFGRGFSSIYDNS